MPYELEDAVHVTAKIHYRDGQGDGQVIDLTNETGTVKKVDGDHVYVQTQYGMHYLKDDKVSPA